MTKDLTRRGFLGLAAVSAIGAVAGSSASAVYASGTTPSGRGGRVDWNSLGRHLDGDLVLPSDGRYLQARQLANAQFDSIRPQAVAYCETRRDVQIALAFAQDHSLHTVPRSGGHSFGGYSTTQGLVLDVSRMNQIRMRGPNVVIGAGTQQVDALGTLTPHGMALVSGICPTVGVGGFMQGGGIGWQTRKYGMACDQLVEATVVLADRRVVRASADEHPDLFWALRGNGGGNYGVITSYELKPVHRRTMVSYMVSWSWDIAKEVIEHWQRWAIDSSNDLASILLAMIPDLGQTPQLVVLGNWYGTVEELNGHLDTLAGTIGVTPAVRNVIERSVFDATMDIYGCAQLTTEQCHRVGTSPVAQTPRQNYYHTRSRMFDEPAPNVDQLLEALAAPGKARSGQNRMLYFETLGGAANVPARTDTAYVHRTTEMLIGYTGTLNHPDYTDEDTTACEEWLADSFRVLSEHSLPESYQNYMDPSLPDWRQAYYAENYPRLVQIKRRYDPHRFFNFARSIG